MGVVFFSGGMRCGQILYVFVFSQLFSIAKLKYLEKCRNFLEIDIVITWKLLKSCSCVKYRLTC